ncbi:MAG: outer membrane protein assembly factor BamD [Candidatus Tokpelaia sp. JSC085]|nr:MAG: outer membrane protein assembly factor BamD [Candidatus Tokpelaia sp. JSC085]
MTGVIIVLQSMISIARRLVLRILDRLIICCVVLSLSGCADKGKDATADGTDLPKMIYNQALSNLNSGHLREAARGFEAIDKQYPYTEFARKSLVMGAWTYYLQNQYDEAINMAKRYIALSQTADDAAYAYYIIGLAHFSQIPDVTRDQEDARRTIDAMQKVIDSYPRSEYVADAKVKIRFAREQLAGKEMQIGRYYLERKQYIAAIRRFRLVVEQYSKTHQIEEALYRLTEANYTLGLAAEAQMAAYVLGQYYPESQWYADAFTLLQKGRLNPQEDKKGWLFPIFHEKK